MSAHEVAIETIRSLKSVATFAAWIFFLTCGRSSADDTVAMVYLVGPDRIQVMASDITSVNVGEMTEDGWRKRSAVRVCFNDAVHKRILASVRKNLKLNDHFKVVVGCAVAADTHITSFEGIGTCNFFMSTSIHGAIALAAEIKTGMTRSGCSAYISQLDQAARAPPT